MRDALRREGAQPRRIVDFGAGIGNSVPFFRSHFPDAELLCLDVSGESLKIARQRFGDVAQYLTLDGAALPLPDGSVDLAFSACVFHHIDHAVHGRCLAELHRVLAPGGSLFVFEHNPYNPLTVAAVRDCEFDRNAKLVHPHRLRRAVAGAGFGRVTTRFRIFFPRPLAALRPLEAALTWLPLGAQYFVRGRKPAA